MITVSSITRRALAVAILCFASNSVFSQIYTQDKPIRFIAGFPAGSASDNLARILAKELTQILGKTVVVDNRPGATGNIAAEAAAKAAPDGYTILLATNIHATVSSLYRKLPFHPIKDFAPVGLVATSPAILIVNKSLPVSSLSDLLRLAKAKPGQLSYGSAGNGSAPHLTMELFKTTAGLDIVHIPYKGVPGALTDLLGGRIPIMFSTMSPAIPLIKSNKVKALAITSAERFPILPEVPALSESLPGFEVLAWWGLLVPTGTPGELVDTLNQAIVKITRMPNVRQNLVEQGYSLTTGTPEGFGVFIKSEIMKWEKVVKISGARLD